MKIKERRGERDREREREREGGEESESRRKEGAGRGERDKRGIFPSSQLGENRQRLDAFLNRHTFIRRQTRRHTTTPSASA